MAQPTNTYDSYDAANTIREDISDIVMNISPEATPFYSMIKKGKASNTYVEWLTDSLRSSAANAHVEGDATTPDAVTAEVRRGNYCQIFKNAVVVPDTDMGLNNIGKTRQLAFQMMKQAKAQKLDIEKALLDNNARVAGNSTTARELAGAPAWLITNTDFSADGTPAGADPTGDGTDARTDDSTPVAFSQTRLDGVLQSIWEQGGDPDVCLLSSFQMNAALGFTGINNQRSSIQASEEKIVKSFDFYQTPWGAIRMVPSRENRSRDVFVFQTDTWEVATLRPTKQTDLAKTGDNTTKQIVTELTLKCMAEAANGIIADCTTS